MRLATRRSWVIEDQRETEPLADLGQQFQHLGLHRDVQCGNWLVGDDDPRFGHQSARDADPLSLATGELMWVPSHGTGIETDQVQNAGRAMLCLLS